MTLSSLAGATILYNAVDSPVGCIPVTRVDPDIDQLTDEWVHGPGLGTKIIENQLYKGKEEWLKEILGQKRVKEADWTRVVERLPKSSGLA